MTHFIIHKRTKGQFKIEVIVDYAFGGEFLTTDSTLIDDIKDWLNGNSMFMNYDTRAELEFDVREMVLLYNHQTDHFSLMFVNL